MSVDIATLGIKVDASETDKAATSLDKMTEAGTKAEAKTKDITTATGELNANLKATAEAAAATSTAHTSTATASTALGNSLKNTKSAANDASAAVGGAGASASVAEKALSKLSETMGLTEGQSGALSESFGKIKDAIDSGKEPIEALKAELPTIGAAFGSEGIGGAATAFAGDYAGVVAGVAGSVAIFAAVAAIVVVAAKAMDNYTNSVAAYQPVADGLGRMSGITAQGFEDIAEASSKSSNQTISDTRASVAAFASAGVDTKQSLTDLSNSVAEYAKLTGEDAPSALKELASSFADPASAAEDLQAKFGLLTGAEYEHIQRLAEAGDKSAATAELTRILSRDMAENTDKVQGLAIGMRVLSDAASSVVSWFGRVDTSMRTALGTWDKWIHRNLGDTGSFLLSTGNENFDPNKKGNPNAQRNQNQAAALVTSGSMNTTGTAQYNDLLAKQSILQRGLADTTGLTTAQVARLNHDYAAVNDTIKVNTTATGEMITTQQRAHLVAVAQHDLAKARNQTEKAAAQQRITSLQSGSQVLTQSERQTKAEDAYNTVHDKYIKGQKAGTDGVAKHIAQLQASVEAQYEVNDATSKGAGVLLQANASRAAAVEMAGKNYSATQRELEQTLQLTLAVEKYIGTVDQLAASVGEKLSAQQAANAQVASGAMSQVDANKEMQIALTLLPMQQVLAVSTGKAHEELAAAIEKVRAGLEGLNSAAGSSALLGNIERTKQATKLITTSIGDVGKTPLEAAVSGASAKADNDIAAMGKNAGTADEQKAYKQALIDQATETVHLKTAQDAYNDSLKATTNYLNEVASNAKSTAGLLSDAFGSAGEGLGQFITILADSKAQHSQFYDDLLAKEKEYSDGSIESQGALAQARAEYAQKMQDSELDSIGGIIHATKGLLNTKSTAYKVMEGVEKAYAAVRLALTIKEIVTEGILTTTKVAGAGARMATDSVETASSVAHSGIRAAADGVAAFAKTLASLPFPFNLIAGAAVLAALVGVGVAIAGGGGSSSATASAAKDEVKPTDYTQQESDYSVGSPTKGYGSSSSSSNGSGAASFSNDNGKAVAQTTGTNTFVYNIDAKSSDDPDAVVTRVQGVMESYQQDTINKARDAVRSDNMNAQNRQSIGGAK